VENGQLNWIANFIWGIVDDVLRDYYVRGKYRDIILPMTVIRRLDAVLEPTKQDVLHWKHKLDEEQFSHGTKQGSVHSPVWSEDQYREDCHHQRRPEYILRNRR